MSENKLGCVVRMVIDSLLPHAKSGPNDHRKDAPPLRTKMPSLLQKWICSDYFIVKLFQSFLYQEVRSLKRLSDIWPTTQEKSNIFKNFLTFWPARIYPVNFTARCSFHINPWGPGPGEVWVLKEVKIKLG